MGRESIPRCAAIGRAWLLNRHRQLQCLVKSRCRGSTNPCRGWTEAERSIAHPNSIPPDTTCCYYNAAEWAAPPTPQDHNHNFSLDSTPGLNRKRAWSVRNSNLPKPTHTRGPRVIPNTHNTHKQPKSGQAGRDCFLPCACGFYEHPSGEY